MDIGAHEQILKNQQNLDRLSQVKISRDKARARFRHKEEDISGLNIVKDAYNYARTEAQMRDNHRLARVRQLNVRGKEKMKYTSDDLSRSNYQGHYEV